MIKDFYLKEGCYKALFDEIVETVYNKVIDHVDCSWREDLMSVEVVDENTFIEQVVDGSKNKMKVLERVPNERYRYVLESKNFVSQWEAEFSSTPTGGTEMIITEQLLFTKRFQGFFSHFAVNLEKIHRAYVNTLTWSLAGIDPHHLDEESEESAA